MTMGNTKKLTVCHVNIRGLNESKLASIEASLCGAYDVITISETFLSDNRNTEDLSLPGYYDIIRKDRPTFGGGVAVYIKNNISFSRKVEYEAEGLESIWLVVNTCQGPMLLCSLYRPPNNNQFWELLDNNLEYVKSVSKMKNVIILGDLNADPSSNMGSYLNNICISHNLTCHINEPTRITPTSQSCLDQILSSMPNFVTNPRVMPPVSTNDHCTVSVDVNFSLPVDEPYYRHVWIYKKGDYESYRKYILNYDWDECFKTSDVNIACDSWTEALMNIASMFIPNKIVLVRPKDKPWFTSALRLLRRKMNRAFKDFKANSAGPLHMSKWEKYTRLRDLYKDRIREAISKYNADLNKSLGEDIPNDKRWWNTVNKVLGKAGDDSIPPIKDLNSNAYLSTSKLKAGAFNSYFLSHTKLNTSGSNLDQTVHPHGPVLDTIHIMEDEVLDQLKALSANKATGPDNVSARILKEAGVSIVPSLTRLINMSLQTCEMPLAWKKANVIPLHKKGEKDILSNYRPISILSVVSKVFEKVIFKHVYNYLHSENFLTKHQSGFRPRDSTVNQLAYLYHTFSKALDDKLDVRLVFCDVSKAFDRVWHQGLIYKLNRAGITGPLLSWFTSYLKDRNQRVLIKGQHSEWGQIGAGVPQGSVLGPLLFLVYINDLVECVNCHIKLFADDTTLFMMLDDENLSANVLNDNLCKVKDWADRWLVTFNPTKTESMVISNKRSSVHPPLYYGNVQIQEVDTHKHLGLTFSSRLSWLPHIKSLLNNVSKLHGVLCRLKNTLDRSVLYKIYKTFVRPKLEYASVIWSDCTEREKGVLERLQLSFARIVSGARKGTKNEHLYRDVKWLKLEERRQRNTLLFMHKLVYGEAPDYLVSLLPDKSINYNLRHNFIPQFRARTEKFNNSLIVNGIKLWNSLPQHIKNIQEISVFKRAITRPETDNVLYSIGQRKIQIIHSQLRLECSLLASHLYNIHVKDSPNCSICSVKEDSKHFFFECPLFNTQRDKLYNSVQSINAFNLDTLLFGSDELTFDENAIVFEAVHEYIVSTKRFDI